MHCERLLATVQTEMFYACSVLNCNPQVPSEAALRNMASCYCASSFASGAFGPRLRPQLLCFDDVGSRAM